jgi:hypothetical protein
MDMVIVTNVTMRAFLTWSMLGHHGLGEKELRGTSGAAPGSGS